MEGKVTEMEKRGAGKEMMEHMEYLVSLLHREWERSGRTEVEAVINFRDVPRIGRMITKEAAKRQKQAEGKEMELEQSMELSKENFIFLRLMKKIKEAGDMEKTGASGISFPVEMDREEYLFFSMLLKDGEA